MKDKRNRHGAVGESSLKQHFRKSATIRELVKRGIRNKQNSILSIFHYRSHSIIALQSEGAICKC